MDYQSVDSPIQAQAHRRTDCPAWKDAASPRFFGLVGCWSNRVSKTCLARCLAGVWKQRSLSSKSKLCSCLGQRVQKGLFDRRPLSAQNPKRHVTYVAIECSWSGHSHQVRLWSCAVLDISQYFLILFADVLADVFADVCSLLHSLLRIWWRRLLQPACRMGRHGVEGRYAKLPRAVESLDGCAVGPRAARARKRLCLRGTGCIVRVTNHVDSTLDHDGTWFFMRHSDIP